MPCSGRRRRAASRTSPGASPRSQFALAAAGAELDLRPPLVELYRALKDAGGTLTGDELQQALQGAGAHPRSPALCARLLTVLSELSLATYDGGHLHAERSGTVELDRSPTYTRCQQRLTDARRHLAAAMPVPLAA